MSPAATRRASAGLVEDTIRGRISRDLLLLADLHDHEPDRAAVFALWSRCYDGLLEAKPYGPALRDAVNRFSDSLTEIPTCFDADAGAALLADFRRVCATEDDSSRAPGSAGSELDTDALRIEAKTPHQWTSPRDMSAESGLWDDGSGLAARLRHLAYLVAADGVAAPAERLKQYLDERLRRCVDRFVAEVAVRSGTHFFQELGVLTAAYVRELAQRFANRDLDRQHAPDQRERPATAPPVHQLASSRHTRSAAEIPRDMERST